MGDLQDIVESNREIVEHENDVHEQGQHQVEDEVANVQEDVKQTVEHHDVEILNPGVEGSANESFGSSEDSNVDDEDDRIREIHRLLQQKRLEVAKLQESYD